MFTDLSAFQTTCILVVSLLSVASAAIFILRRLKPLNETFAKVAVIIRSWWLIAGAYLLALSWPRWGILIFMYALTILALREYLKISQVPYKRYLLVSLSVLCTLQYALIGVGSLPLFLSALPVLCLWVVPGLVIFRATISNLELVTSVGLGLAMLVYYTSHIAGLSAFPQLGLTPDEATFAVLILILITWCNDVFQFLAGKIFGHRKIVPEISPNKTLAGFIGGMAGTTLLAGFLAPELMHLSLEASVGLGVLIGFTGMFGDLFFSAVKRKIGVKDFSQALPGHGGLLDRLDSLVFTAPIYFHYILLIKG